MKSITTILYALSILILFSCNNQDNFIIETDLNILLPDTINGQTISQTKKKGEYFNQMVRKNTINKKVPDIIVFSLTGKKLHLKEILQKKTILISTDSYCGFGRENLTNDFPKAIDSLERDLLDFEIICLVKRTELDLEEPIRFEKLTKELISLYKNIYIIDEYEAYKMNLFSNPARFYIDNNQEVKHISSGLSSIERQINEVKLNTTFN